MYKRQVTTHVLDATSGRPAADVEVTLERHAGQSWQLITSGRTDPDAETKVAAAELRDIALRRISQLFAGLAGQ